MAKTRTQYICQNCGYTAPGFMGRCPRCREYNTMAEVVVEKTSPADRRRTSLTPISAPRRLSEIEAESLERWRMSLGEFARVLGGGMVPGSVVLLGGDPGIGKSTLLLQVAGEMANRHGTVLYASGEESAQQIKMRADRLGIKADALYLVTETNLENILAHVEKVNPRLLVVDSIQTTYTDAVASSAGSVTQVRECAAQLQALAKSSGLGVFVVGHVTKQGSIAGPRVLEHIVDVVLYLEGDAYQTYRLLRGVKNRFGATSEVGVFEMHDGGMVEVSNPSEAFLAERMVNAPGSTIAVTMEGTRPLLVEVQALTSPTPFGNPRRTANGVNMNRLLLMIAVLTRRAGFRLGEQDVFVNVVGGLRIDEPAADLATAVAIASSLRDVPVPADLAIVGEVGLSGELRAVSQLAARLKEAAQLGFKRCLVPRSVRRRGAEAPPDGIDILSARSLHEALRIALPGGREDQPS
ncbi:MAG: DNA repair protein RadA [Anaerolineae bacterium]|nr:DNA repair protein RadA [Anaerolineae bacterium]